MSTKKTNKIKYEFTSEDFDLYNKLAEDSNSIKKTCKKWLDKRKSVKITIDEVHIAYYEYLCKSNLLEDASKYSELFTQQNASDTKSLETITDAPKEHEFWEDAMVDTSSEPISDSVLLTSSDPRVNYYLSIGYKISDIVHKK